MDLKRSAKQLVRHVILRSGLNQAFLAWRAARGEDVSHLRMEGLTNRFSAIYQRRAWMNGRSEGSRSGLGSELENTQTIRRDLPQLLANLDTKVLLDVGCGDFNWMRDVALDCDYIGVDVVPSVIDLNAQNFPSPRRTFRALDATKDPLPHADTALCREVLFHLSFADIWALIGNLRKSGISALIATHDPDTRFNADIVSGDFRLLNLNRPPFGFPQPTLQLADAHVSQGRVLAVWHMTKLPRR